MNSSAREYGGRAAAGFTILETVIALTIAMVVGFGAISLFLFSMSYNAGASDRARALALAQQRMEGLRATPYASLVTTNTTETVSVGSTLASKPDMRTFTVLTKIDSDPAVPNNRQRIITITVTPAEAGRFTAGAVSVSLLRASDQLGAN